MLPPIYADAELRNITPVCRASRRIGIGFDVPGQQPQRFAISLEAARDLAALLDAYIKSFEASQTAAAPAPAAEGQGAHV